MTLQRSCCCEDDGCYKLQNCNPPHLVKYSDTDLSAYVGKIVRWSGECWSVEETTTCGDSTESVTVTDDWTNCSLCIDEGDYSSCCEVGDCCFGYPGVGMTDSSRVLVTLNMTQDDPSIGDSDCCDDTKAWFSGTWEMPTHRRCNYQGGKAKTWLSTTTVAQSCRPSAGDIKGHIIYRIDPVFGGVDDVPSGIWTFTQFGSISAPSIVALGGDCCGGTNMPATASSEHDCGSYSGTMSVSVVDNTCCGIYDEFGHRDCESGMGDCDSGDCESTAP